MAIVAISSPAFGAQEDVILLHGLCRTSHSMMKMEYAVTEADYKVQNVDYPSRTASIQKLADDAIGKAVADCEQSGATKIHFVTHSIGGILVRSYLARHTIPIAWPRGRCLRHQIKEAKWWTNLAGFFFSNGCTARREMNWARTKIPRRTNSARRISPSASSPATVQSIGSTACS